MILSGVLTGFLSVCLFWCTLSDGFIMVIFIEDSHIKEHFILVFLLIWLSSSASSSMKQSLSIVLKYFYGIKYRFYLSIFFLQPRLKVKKNHEPD